MTTRALRRTNRRAHTYQSYPHDPGHPVASYEQTQRDAGAALLIGAVVVAVLMILIGLGIA